MKKLQTILSGLLGMFLAVGFFILTTGCEGPQGPEGEPGSNAMGTCIECHDMSSDLKAKIIQYNNSLHATGSAFARNETNCAPCHSSEGFRERILTGAQTTATVINNPTPPDCRTCHNIHSTYTDKDYELTTTAPVTLWVGGETINVGKGNLCVNCHQPRPTSPMPVPDGDSISITSNRWGPHYGTQSVILAGVGGIKFPNPSVPYNNSIHKTAVKDGCVGCHMQLPYGNQAGGHTMLMGYGEEGETPLAKVCATCHEGATNFDLAGTQTTIDSLMTILKEKLYEKGIYNKTNDLAKPGKHAANVAAAYYNYKTVAYDRSRGVHNFKYTKALLINSIDKLQ